MSTFRSDPLLGLAKVLLTIAMVLFVIGVVSIGIGSGVMLVMKDTVIARLVENGGAPEAFWAIMLMLPLAAALLMLAYRFAENLRAIIRTVELGDPFTPQNAVRLRTMGWLTLGFQLLAVPITAVGVWIGNTTRDIGNVNVDAEVSANGLLLALVLFILARVFKTGAQMREDLEGTV